MPPTNPTEQAWRWRNDDGSEAGASWAAAANTAIYLTPNRTIRARFALLGFATASGPIQLQYKQNSGAWTNVAQNDPVVQPSGSAYVTQSADTTKQLVSSSYTYLSPNHCWDGAYGYTPTVAVGSDCLDIEFGIQVLSSGVAPGDTISLRLLQLGAPMAGSFTTCYGTVAGALSFNLSETASPSESVGASSGLVLNEAASPNEGGVFFCPPTVGYVTLNESAGPSDAWLGQLGGSPPYSFGGSVSPLYVFADRCSALYIFTDAGI